MAPPTIRELHCTSVAAHPLTDNNNSLRVGGSIVGLLGSGWRRVHQAAWGGIDAGLLLMVVKKPMIRTGQSVRPVMV